jgi:Rieske Fe-S protein
MSAGTAGAAPSAWLTSRRSVLTGTLVTVAAGAVGYAVANNTSLAKAKKRGSAANGYGAAPGGGKRLAAAAEVPTGGGVIVGNVVLTRDAAGNVHGFSAVCTHQGCTVDSVAAGAISCPCHGSKFDAATGAVVNGPADKPLPPVTVTVRGDDIFAG